LENHGNSGKCWEKIKKIRADLSENRLNSGNFITILHKNSGKLSTAPWKSSAPYTYENIHMPEMKPLDFG
jgi:hypothetical protein